MDHLQLSLEVDAAGNDRKRGGGGMGGGLAARVVLQRPCRPAIRKQEAITISSIFTTHSPIFSLLFMSSSPLLLFWVFPLRLYSLSFHFRRSQNAPLSSARSASVAAASSAPVRATKSFI